MKGWMVGLAKPPFTLVSSTLFERPFLVIFTDTLLFYEFLICGFFPSLFCCQKIREKLTKVESKMEKKLKRRSHCANFLDKTKLLIRFVGFTKRLKI